VSLLTSYGDTYFGTLEVMTTFCSDPAELHRRLAGPAGGLEVLVAEVNRVRAPAEEPPDDHTIKVICLQLRGLTHWLHTAPTSSALAN
jgi:hypothetical protein